MANDVDCIVLGAGVVGLACARQMAQQGMEVLLIEQTASIGNGVSSRNSEVIHAGIYYTPGSLKARLCVEGKARLYDYCQEHHVDHARCGKLIVATTPEQEADLLKLQAQARACGVDDLQWLNAAQAQALELALNCSAALLSPSTGIVDTHALMLALQGDAENHGAQLVFNTPFVSARVLPGQGFEVHVGGAEAFSLTSTHLINAAGLGAVAAARQIEGLDASHIPHAYLCKGSYFSLAGRSPFKHLIYPMPNKAGLGVHLTLDLAGQARFGPDTEWVQDENYDMDPQRGQSFYAAVREYWPALPDNSLNPAYSGIRPKIVPAGHAAADFVFSGPAEHGIPGLLNLFGIESPGLTACLAIAQHSQETLAQAA
ncbi:NAD(P)/FAD-dependent oxidoreductase [Alcaligenes sp. A-TC2]|uniref:NAD(P)/FAD-dependent oxidoreductase n=1 Tax=Alcaligenes nematophilus TaxID=2994643 RepID=UPI00224F10AB|nr:NAD(P)/FAD-dependent oxidoreductase [Alcaligenes nematophilus]MCX5471306.1 NAD(P)/FAD-dependent oxidoreductase [Alcaligenes nematophilus]